MKSLILFMHRRPTTFAAIVLLVVLAPVWALTADGGVLSWWGL